MAASKHIEPSLTGALSDRASDREKVPQSQPSVRHRPAALIGMGFVPLP